MKKLTVLLLLLVLAISSNAQAWKRSRIEVYAGLPITHYFGDIGGTASGSNMFGLKDISFRALRPGFSVGAIYRLNQLLYVQGSANFFLLGSTDEGSRNESRNYGFSTFGTELAATLQLYIIQESDQNYFYNVMQLRGGIRHIKRPFSMYLFAGGGGLIYKVSPRLNLETSERFNDSESFSAVIPFGIGVKYHLLPRTLLSAELGVRYSLTDYIDGISPATSAHNDIYYVLNFKVHYRIPYQMLLKKRRR